MRKISRIEPKVPSVPKRKKVAAYARVSEDRGRLRHSMSAQVSRYSAMIQQNPEWEYAGVYADLGISGTTSDGREEFVRMLADCEAGKIDIVLTKSISRFARNTVDLLETVRHLKGLGIEVRFEKEKINSLSEDGELMLTLLASFAQEESRSISENVKWAIRKGFEKGKTNSFCIYGYRWDGQEFHIVPEEAEVVRLIYSNYLKGMSAEQTERQLEEMGVKSYTGGHFSNTSIRAILRNEKYTGNMLLQKSYIQDHITHKTVINHGELPMYYAENTHPAIISQETFDAVQEEMERRRRLGTVAYPNIKTSCFTGKILCEHCRRNYHRRTCCRQSTDAYKVWRCSVRERKGKKYCASIDMPEYKLKQEVASVLGLPGFDEEAFREQVDYISVPADNEMVFHFHDGRVLQRHWDNTGYLDAWTEERRRRKSEFMKKENARRREAKKNGKG